MAYNNESAGDKILRLTNAMGSSATTIASSKANKNLASKEIQLQREKYIYSLDNNVYTASAQKAYTGIENMFYGNEKTGKTGFFKNQLNNMDYETYDADTEAMLSRTLTVDYLTKNFGMTASHAERFIEENGDALKSEAMQRSQTNRFMSEVNQLGTASLSYSQMAIAKGGSWNDVYTSVNDHYNSIGGRSWDFSGTYDPNNTTVRAQMATDLGLVNAKKSIDSSITNANMTYGERLQAAYDEYEKVLADADDGSEVFLALRESSEETIKSSLISYISQQAGIAQKSSSDKSRPMTSFLAQAQISETPVSREQFDAKCAEFGLDPNNVYDRDYMESAWITQSTNNKGYEAKALAEEEEKVAVMQELELQKSTTLKDQASIYEAQGDYLTAGTYRTQATEIEYGIIRTKMEEMGLDTSELDALLEADKKNIETLASLKQGEYDEQKAKEAEAERKRIESEKVSVQNSVRSVDAKSLEAEADNLESQGRHVEAGELRQRANSLVAENTIASLRLAGASDEQIAAVEASRDSTNATIGATATNNQTEYNNQLAQQTRTQKFDRIASFISDMSSDIQKAMIAAPEMTTLYTDENGQMAGYYKIVDEHGNVYDSDIPVASSISEYMYKNGEGVTSVSTKYWPIAEEFGKKLGVINPDGSIADAEGLAILVTQINSIGNTAENTMKTATQSNTHTEAYTNFMATYWYDESKTPDEVQQALDEAQYNGMTQEEYNSLKIEDRDNPATRKQKTIIDSASSFITVLTSSAEKGDEFNSEHARYMLEHDIPLLNAIYAWGVNHPDATATEIQQYAEQVATDLLFNEFYKTIEDDIKISLNDAHLLEDTNMDYVYGASVDELYGMYLDRDISHLVRQDALISIKTSLSNDVFSSEEDLFEATSQLIYGKEYGDLSNFEQATVLVNSAIAVKDTNMYNNACEIPNSLGLKVSEVFVEGYGPAVIDEEGIIYTENPNGGFSMRYVGKTKYEEAKNGIVTKLAIDSSLPVENHRPHVINKPITTPTGFGDIYDVYNQNALDGVSLTDTIVDAAKIVSEVAKGKEFEGVDVGTSIGSAHAIYNTGNGAEAGVGQGLGIFQWIRNKLFNSDPIGTKEVEETQEDDIDMALLGKRTNLKGGN